jgi:hypothetical protein
MVVTSVLSTDAEMIAMAGELVDVTGFTEANKTAWGIQAEAFLCMLTNYDLVTNVGTLGAKFKAILSEYVARYVACSAIAYNMSGFSLGLIEAEDMIQFHVYRMEAIEKILNNGESLPKLGVS